MYTNISSFFINTELFINSIIHFLKQYELENIINLDHVCYKCESSSEYDFIRSIIEKSPYSLYLYQSFLSNRRVSYFKLTIPFKTEMGDINFLELADKKPDLDEISGFHHIEIYPVKTSLENILLTLKHNNIIPVFVNRPHHKTYDIKQPNFIIRITHQPLIQEIFTNETEEYSNILNSPK